MPMWAWIALGWGYVTVVVVVWACVVVGARAERDAGRL
jgi:hypothetical protein